MQHEETVPPPADRMMRILYCANAAYYPHVAVSALSVADRNRGCRIEIHLMTCDRDDGAEGLLRASLAAAPDLDLITHRVDPALIDGFFVRSFWSRECYLRLFAAEILPKSINRVLYLDPDTVVVDDLWPLWTLDLGGKLLAAAPDYPIVPEAASPERRRILGIPPDHDYVNSGVLVMDLDRWRRDGALERLVPYIEQHADRLMFPDQDAINGVLFDEILRLDCRWNLQARMYRAGRRHYPREFIETVEARRRPAVIHYTGSEKPWLFRSRTARKGDYVRYRRRTAWPSADSASVASTGQRLEFGMDRWLSLIGIDYLQLLWTARRVPSRLAEASGLLRPVKRDT